MTTYESIIFDLNKTEKQQTKKCRTKQLRPNKYIKIIVEVKKKKPEKNETFFPFFSG